MDGTSIGIQVIMPQTGTSPQSTPEQQANAREAASAPAETKQASPPPGDTGRFVDKTV